MRWVTRVSDYNCKIGWTALVAAGAALWAWSSPATVKAQIAPPAQVEPLKRLVHGLPWPGVSSLIGYRGRLWFANSVKFVNHNSADLYSFDPVSGKARYEKHLFSQDSGEPVVANGLLYWPFEDSRFSPGHGEFMVTNGRDWDWRVIPQGRVFHTHAMVASAGRLVAALSAWTAKLAVSSDKGVSWSLAYEYPTPDRRVSRITALTSLNGTVFAGLTTWYDDSGPKLLKMGKNGVAPVPGWPGGSEVAALMAYEGWVYGINTSPEGSALLRTDGELVERLTGPKGIVDDFAVGPHALWAVTAGRRSGVLWRSVDGRNWARVQRFEKGRPLSVALFGGLPYVGIMTDQGGELWGHGDRKPVAFRRPFATMPKTPRLSPPSRVAALAELDTVLADATRYRGLRYALRPLAQDRSRESANALMRRLSGPFATGTARMFGRREIATERMAQWYLLWAIAHNGHGRIPVDYIKIPWTAKPGPSEKYIRLPPAASWAYARLGQRDPVTLAALIARLDRPGDPKWLTGDVIGALTDLTGKRFGYDIDAWKRWWRAQKPGR
jgi:hypothetical protein